MQSLGALLVHDHELLLVFVVILSGLVLGSLEYRGVQLGSAGVLFAGLGFGAWLEPTTLERTTALKEFGLVVFVYCVGLSSGPGFFSAWRSRGLRLNVAIALALACGALAAVLGGSLLGLDRGHIAGVFCGALTNTPALGAAQERLEGTPLVHPRVRALATTCAAGSGPYPARACESPPLYSRGYAPPPSGT